MSVKITRERKQILPTLISTKFSKIEGEGKEPNCVKRKRKKGEKKTRRRSQNSTKNAQYLKKSSGRDMRSAVEGK